MANDFTSNPIKIDTVIASNYVPADGEISFPLYVSGIYWYNPGSINDLAVVQNIGGKLRWQGRCEVANASQYFKFEPPLQFKGLLVPTLGSGTLFLYLAKVSS